jgi:hypothetical protein
MGIENHESNLKIQVPGKNFQAPWQPGALYLSTPGIAHHRYLHYVKLHLLKTKVRQGK